MKRKIISIFFALAVLFTLTLATSASSAPSPTPPNPESSPQEPEAIVSTKMVLEVFNRVTGEYVTYTDAEFQLEPTYLVVVTHAFVCHYLENGTLFSISEHANTVLYDLNLYGYRLSVYEVITRPEFPEVTEDIEATVIPEYKNENSLVWD